MSAPVFNNRPTSTLPELQRAVFEFSSNVTRVAGGVVISGVSVGTSDTKVAHGLGAVPAAVLVMPRADARVWESATATTTQVTLRASAAVTCTVLVIP